MASEIVAALQVQEIDGQLLIDSRLIADRLGIQHRGLIQTIDKHLARLQSKSQVRFEMEMVKLPQGGAKQKKFAYLDERQATLLMTMSRNTDQVLDCKEALVDAFEKAKLIIKTVIPAQSDRIRELELEIQLRNAEAHSAFAQQKLLDTRHYITTALPEPLQQKILGYSEVKTVEYRDRVYHDDDLVRDGSTVNKTTLCKRLKFFTRNGKPDYKRLNDFLTACNLPESAWRLTAAIQENLELTSEAAFEVEQRWFASPSRDRYLGEN
jgi:phage regulator Rha-like protein